VENDDDNVLVFRGDRPVAVPESIVLEAQRPYRAYQAHLAGKPWSVVATDEGYPSGDAARSEVRRYLTEGRSLVSEWTRQEMLAIELARLDALQAACWEAAIGGKLPAIALARDLIVTRIKMQKLDEIGDEGDTKARTVVVNGDEVSYVTTLERLSEE
jgi:hypothetical protein